MKTIMIDMDNVITNNNFTLLLKTYKIGSFKFYFV